MCICSSDIRSSFFDPDYYDEEDKKVEGYGTAPENCYCDSCFRGKHDYAEIVLSSKIPIIIEYLMCRNEPLNSWCSWEYDEHSKEPYTLTDANGNDTKHINIVQMYAYMLRCEYPVFDRDFLKNKVFDGVYFASHEISSLPWHNRRGETGDIKSIDLEDVDIIDIFEALFMNIPTLYKEYR